MRAVVMLPTGLRGRLVILVLLATMPLLALSLYGVFEWRRQAQLDAQEEMLLIARGAASRHEQAIENARLLLLGLARHPAVRGLEAESCNAELVQTFSKRPPYVGGAAVRPDGTVFCASVPLPGPLNLANQEHVRRALSTRNFAVGDYIIASVTRRPSLFVALPIIDSGSGSVQVVVTAGLDLEWLSQDIARVTLPPDTTVTIFDRHGTILMRSHEPERYVGTNVSDVPVFRATLAQAEPHVAEAAGLGGIPRVFGFVPLRGQDGRPDGYVAIGRTKAAVVGPANRALLWGVTWIALLVATLVTGVWILAVRFIISPVESLERAAEQLASGEVGARALVETSTPREIVRLVHAFNSMAQAMSREQADLRSQRRFLRQVIDLNPSFVFAKDRDGRFTLVNQAVADAYGTTVEQLLGKTDADFNENADEIARFRRDDLDVMDSRRDKFTLEESITTASGQVRWLQTVKRALVGEDSMANQVLGVATDITERKSLELQLAQAQKMEAVGQLAGGIAHDFNNLLTVILGRCQLLLNGADLGERARRSLETISRTGERAARLTRQLLAFSRKQILEPRVVDLNSLVSDVARMLEQLIGEHIRLIFRPADGLDRVRIDPGQIEQILMNLAVNARDAMPDGGLLTIETANVELGEDAVRQHVGAQPGAYVMLSVSDTGIGMDAATRSRIFEPFFTTKAPGKGTGLGLAVVYGIVQQHGGTIRVYSEPGHGTTFKIYLSRVEDASDVVTAAPHRVEGGSETVLVAEDDDEVRALACEVLRRFGYTVFEARHGAEAIVIAERHDGTIHLLLTDVIMPETSGRALAEQFTRLHPEARVLYMSGYTDNAIAHNGVLDPDAFFLQKPFTPDTLARRVRDVLDAPESP